MTPLTQLDKEIISDAIAMRRLLTVNPIVSQCESSIELLEQDITDDKIQSVETLAGEAIYLVPLLRGYNRSLSEKIKDAFYEEEKNKWRPKLYRCNWLWRTINHHYKSHLAK